VLHQVGAGTLGPVYRAHDAAEGRLVAIKAFRLDLTPERAAAVAADLQALSAKGLAHPSIAEPIAAGVESSTPWLAQAYIAAESLDSALRQYGPPPVADALAIVTHLAGALDFAAAAGVVHGSLHPRDVLVAPDETHVIDIGVAAALEQHGLRATVRRPYGAPERAAGSPASREGDVFALAAIAWELLSGQPVPGAGDEAAAALPEIPGANREALVETFAFALAVAPDERYQSALAFAAPLKRALGEALTLPAPPRRRRTQRSTETLLPLEATPDAADAAPEHLAAEAPVEPSPSEEPSLGSPEIASSEERALREEFGLPDTESRDPAVSGRESRRAPAAGPAVSPPPPVSAGSDAAPHASAHVRDERVGDEGDSRYALLDDPASPLDAVDLNPAAHGTSLAWEDQPEAPAAVQRPEPRAVAVPERPVPTEYVRQDRSPLENERPGSRRPSWQFIAALVFMALLAGFVGGYAVRGGGVDVGGTEPESTVSGAEPSSSDEPQPSGVSSGASEVAMPPEPVPEPAEASPPAAAESTPPSEPASRTEAPPAARPAAARGRISVRTRPAGVSVTVDGRRRGVTPLALTGLPYGTYLVRMSREGFVSDQRRVTLSASRPARSIDVALRRSGPAPAPARSGPPPPSGARVYVDGRLVGTTPMSLASIRIGSHVVRLELDGYRRWSDSVRVVAGERTRVAASLEEAAR
jgi:serine/threonine-protein kinase